MTPKTERVAGMVVRTYGTGPETFVGYHGWSGDHRSFAPLIAHMPSNVRLVAPDLPGFGESPAPSAWTFSAYLDHLDALLEALGHRHVTVIGNCAGAVLAMEQAIRRPNRFGRLVLIDPFAYVPWYFRVLTLPVVGRLFYRATFANPLGRCVTNGALKSKRTEQTHLTAAFDDVDHAHAFAYLRMLCTPRSYLRYGAIHHPVSLLFGERTFFAVRRSVELLGSMWSASRVAVLPRAGHLPIQESTCALAAEAFAVFPPRDDACTPRRACVV